MRSQLFFGGKTLNMKYEHGYSFFFFYTLRKDCHFASVTTSLITQLIIQRAFILMNNFRVDEYFLPESISGNELSGENSVWANGRARWALSTSALPCSHCLWSRKVLTLTSFQCVKVRTVAVCVCQRLPWGRRPRKRTKGRMLWRIKQPSLKLIWPWCGLL